MNGVSRGPRATDTLRRWSFAALALVPLTLAGATGAWAAKGQGWLGVSLQELTPTLRDGMNVKTPGGVLIGDVTDGSPADKAGLQEGDIVTRINGQKVDEPSDIQEVVREAGAGATVSLHVVRNGSEKDLTATLAARVNTDEDNAMSMMRRSKSGERAPRVRVFDNNRGAESSNNGYLGVQLGELTSELRTYFGIDGDNGVLISEVEKDSPAAAAGLRAGDVLVKVGDEAVSSSSEARSEIRDHKPGSSVSLTIVRDKVSKTLSATLDKAPVGEVSMSEIPGLEGLRGLEGLKGLEGLEGMKGFQEFRSPDGSREIRIKRGHPGAAPQMFEFHSDGDDDADSDDDSDSDSDAPRVYRFDSKDGDTHRIIIRDKKSGHGSDDGDEIWGGNGDDGDKNVRVIVKKRHGGSRDERMSDRDLRREIRDLEKQIDDLKDQIGDDDDDK